MAWSCATWFREPCKVRKEAAVSGVPGAPQPTGPEWSALRARAALQRGGVRGHFPVRTRQGYRQTGWRLVTYAEIEPMKDAGLWAGVIWSGMPLAVSKRDVL